MPREELGLKIKAMYTGNCLKKGNDSIDFPLMFQKLLENHLCFCFILVLASSIVGLQLTFYELRVMVILLLSQITWIYCLPVTFICNMASRAHWSWQKHSGFHRPVESSLLLHSIYMYYLFHLMSPSLWNKHIELYNNKKWSGTDM